MSHSDWSSCIRIAYGVWCSISTDPGGPNAVLASADILALDARVTTGQASIDEILSLLFPPDQLAAGQAWLERYLSQPGCCESVSEDVGLRQLDAELGWQTGPGRVGRPG